MKSEAHEEIKELNLAYMMLAQQLIRQDRAGAIYRLGISDDIADLIVDLTPGQVLKMAASNMLLCRFRFEDRMLLGLLSSHDSATGHLHAAILAARQPLESLS
ncbi:MAG: hypothetical protein AMXMBFR6_05980 [Betaproteobacteria bacterium]